MNPFFYFSPFILQTLIWPIVRPALRFFCHLEIHGLKNLEGLKPGVIFAANHISELDPVVIPTSLPFMSRFMPMFYVSRPRGFYIKSGWRKIFYGGFIFKIWGAHPTLKGSGDYNKSLATHIVILNQGGSVLVFPEGHKNPDSEKHDAHGGIAFLSFKTGKPIIPVRFSGYSYMILSDFFLRRRGITITFGAPFSPKDLFSERSPLVDKVRNDYKQAVAETIIPAIFSL